ncbi:hypothetical protein V5799_008314 [Amblyomma americanum]|uniref:Uncharacterized protein n=1 Tax=Amblyomma americanum TaxID=6943 RepID=A0AAQ4FET5_AMBAM
MKDWCEDRTEFSSVTGDSLASSEAVLPENNGKSFVLAFAYTWFALGIMGTAAFLVFFFLSMSVHFAMHPDPYWQLSHRCHLSASECPPLRRKSPFCVAPERTLVCTLGPYVLQRHAYPIDGICSVIIFTHVRYDSKADSLVPVASDSMAKKSWRIFQRRALLYNVTSFMPSFEWKALLSTLRVRRARKINATLVQINMLGLALLGVRLPVDGLPFLTSALVLMEHANPGMFLALGVSFEGMTDVNSASRIPADAMVKPLRLFVLETHIPVTGNACVAGYATPVEPYDAVPRLTLRGAGSLLSHHAFTLVRPGVLTRCFSMFAGAIVFRAENAASKQLLRPGGPCSSWHLASLGDFCNSSRVQVDVGVRAAFGDIPGGFVTFESVHEVDRKAIPMMQKFLDADSPICLAVYGLDLDTMPPTNLHKMACSERYSWCTLAECLRDAIKVVRKAKLQPSVT